MTKRPIDIFRDSAGSFSIANPEDGTAIKEMFTYSDFLLILTEKCAYKIQMADQIDPRRLNASLPKVVQQKLFDYGTESEIVGRTLLTAKGMFRKGFLPDSVDLERGIKLSLEALSEIAAMKTAALEFKELEDRAMSQAEESRRKDGSLVLPAIGHVETKCKTFAQKADHAGAKLFEISKLFYPDAKWRGWQDFADFIRTTFGEQDNFAKLTAVTAPFLQLVRNVRDCLEHGNIRNGLVIKDFAIGADGAIAIALPSIEIDFRGTKQPALSISQFVAEATEKLLQTFELTLTHLCSKNIQPFAGIPIYVGLIPEDRRQNKHVRFSPTACIFKTKASFQLAELNRALNGSAPVPSSHLTRCLWNRQAAQTPCAICAVAFYLVTT
jgi:hypothetical protein